MKFAVTTFYAFVPLEQEELPHYRDELTQEAADRGIRGLVLVAQEGVNATIAGAPHELQEYKVLLQDLFGELTFKDSPAQQNPFKRFKVSIRKEIVQLRRPDIQPTEAEVRLSPQQWDAMMATEDVTLIDVRNWYETSVGSFKGALDPKTDAFSEFPQWLKSSGLNKGKKVGIFCTGGIRCAKAAVAMKEQGFADVVQLDGGILNYLEHRPESNFEGECFVFDHRSTVQQNLQPSKRYGVCPHCGNSGDVEMDCSRCTEAYRACQACINERPVSYCSKRCRNEST